MFFVRTEQVSNRLFKSLPINNSLHTNDLVYACSAVIKCRNCALSIMCQIFVTGFHFKILVKLFQQFMSLSFFVKSRHNWRQADDFNPLEVLTELAGYFVFHFHCQSLLCWHWRKCQRPWPKVGSKFMIGTVHDFVA